MNNYDNLDVNIYKIKTVRSYAEHLKILLEAELDDVTINIREVYKNNDSHLTGLIFIEKNNTLSPTLYVNDCFEGYKHGITAFPSSSVVIVPTSVSLLRSNSPEPSGLTMSSKANTSKVTPESSALS